MYLSSLPSLDNAHPRLAPAALQPAEARGRRRPNHHGRLLACSRGGLRCGLCTTTDVPRSSGAGSPVSSLTLEAASHFSATCDRFGTKADSVRAQGQLTYRAAEIGTVPQ